MVDAEMHAHADEADPVAADAARPAWRDRGQTAGGADRGGAMERADSRRPAPAHGSGRPGRDDDRPARGYRPIGGRGEGAGHGAGHGRATEGVVLEPVTAPPLPDSIEASSLDAKARQDLRGLAKDVAESVARHLVAAGVLVDDDPAQALDHARYARRRASRIAVVREAAGITAYHAGEWAEALADLRAARRMGGGPGHLAVMADIERALGRPERAIEVARGPEAAELDRAAQIELAMVVAGARRDLGELDASVVGLQIPELDPAHRDPWSARLFYAYADNLLAAGRESDAMQWFVHAVDADELGETDAVHRLADLTGEPPPEDDGIDFDVEELAEPYGDDTADTVERAAVVAGPPVSDAPAAVTTATGQPDVVEDRVESGAEAGGEVDAETSDAIVAVVAGAPAAPTDEIGEPSEEAGSSAVDAALDPTAVVGGAAGADASSSVGDVVTPETPADAEAGSSAGDAAVAPMTDVGDAAVADASAPVGDAPETSAGVDTQTSDAIMSVVVDDLPEAPTDDAPVVTAPETHPDGDTATGVSPVGEPDQDRVGTGSASEVGGAAGR